MKSSELTTYGYLAFRSGDYDAAINYFSHLDNKSPSYWSGRMYLAISYWHIGKTSAAMQELKDLSEWCPDPMLKQKAVHALRELNSAKCKPGVRN